MRKVVCAAVRAWDGSLMLGIRHYSQDMHEQLQYRFNGEKFKHRIGEDQGFVDQHGVFMSRSEAYQVAVDAGQSVNLGLCSCDADGVVQLHSEALY